jgi:hypothetical protein
LSDEETWLDAQAKDNTNVKARQGNGLPVRLNTRFEKGEP